MAKKMGLSFLRVRDIDRSLTFLQFRAILLWMSSLPKVLFVCTHKGGRSQIADAIARATAAEVFESESACFDPGTISQEFVDLIGSEGIEIQRESPPSVFSLYARREEFDYVVCVCKDAGSEMCALFRINIERIFPDCIERIHWDIADFNECEDAPEGFKICVENICEEIREKVIQLAERVTKNSLL